MSPARLFNQNIARNMKKKVKFGNHSAVLERSKSVGVITILPALPVKPLSMKLAELADAINEADFVDVHTVQPSGKIVFIVENGISNTILLDVICNAITRAFDTDATVANA